jgi:opacity protein-like surface antigen
MSWGMNVLQKSRSFFLVLVLVVVGVAVVAVGPVSAQQSNSDGSGLSVTGGIGFFAEPNFDGFLLNFGGSYHFDEHVSAGVDFQLGFDDDFVLFSMPFYGQYDFGKFQVDVPVLEDMHAFVKTGLGLTHVNGDRPGGAKNERDTGFLFIIGGGVAYPVTENVSIESRMQFNITKNRFFEDDYYFSWEIVSARFRF